MASSLTGSIQPYTPARVDYLANYLQKLLPGLTHSAATKWINAEKGVSGNVLGVTYKDANGKQHLYEYGSQEAGLRAAVNLLHRKSEYDAFLTSLKTNNTTAEIKALAASPWNHRYYSRVFLGITIKPTSTSTSTAGANAILAAFSTDQATALLQKLGISIDPNHEFSLSEAQMLADEYAKQYNFNRSNALWQMTVDQLTNMKVSDFVSGNTSPDPLAAIGNALGQVGNLFSFVGSNIPEILALLVGVPVALLGFYLLSDIPTTGGAN